MSRIDGASGAGGVARDELLAWIDARLDVASFKDYAPNGLQVEGRDRVSRVLGAVTASLRAIEKAVELGADLLLVHHGFFWRSEPVPIVGWKAARVRALMRADVNMAGYHLPLDAHPEIGNNARLGRAMGWTVEEATGEQNLVLLGRAEKPGTLGEMVAELERVLGRKPVVVGDPASPANRIMWCSGGAQGFMQLAIDRRSDVYVTGEMSEAQYHLALETGVAFVSAGHHATERFGIMALLGELETEFGVATSFFDEPNPI